jgi:hypothetical protein
MVLPPAGGVNVGSGRNVLVAIARERAQLQPEAGRRGRLLSSGPSGGGRADLLDHLASACSWSASGARNSALPRPPT